MNWQNLATMALLARLAAQAFVHVDQRASNFGSLQLHNMTRSYLCCNAVKVIYIFPSETGDHLCRLSKEKVKNVLRASKEEHTLCNC
jgi:hypothetical protein